MVQIDEMMSTSGSQTGDGKPEAGRSKREEMRLYP